MFEPEKFVEESIKTIRDTIKGKAITAVSGGVDSTVSALLVSKAIGDNLLAVYIDTGLMRKNETERVEEMLKSLKINYRILDRKDDFLNSLKGITDPEMKRRIVGERFIRNFEEEALKFGAEYLVQGTIAPDWIESGGGIRDTIKSHHNVGGLPKNISLKIVEPLRDLYKDEVRKLARHLNVPVSERQPFPGPGLAIRIVGEVDREKLEILREATAIVEEEIDKSVEKGEIERPWQYFAILLPIKTVGVHGDKRAYGYTIAVRCIDSIDGMSGTFSNIPYKILEKISLRITNTLKIVNRVVYDITHKPPGTIEWE